MVHFVGAGPGAPDLITLRGKQLLETADVIIYAGSLVNPALLSFAKPECEVYNSAVMTLEEVIAVIEQAEQKNRSTVRLHTGDPSIFGAIREQMDALRARDIAFAVVPGVSSFCGAAASLETEYTLPDVSQTVILTRMAGRTPVPKGQEIAALAAHHATMVLFLSAGMLEELTQELVSGGYSPETPAAIVYKATWEDEKILRGSVATIAALAQQHHITKTALIVVGDCLGDDYALSRLYAADFSTEFREATR